MDGKCISYSSDDVDPIDTSDKMIDCNKMMQSTRFFQGGDFEKGNYSEEEDEVVLQRGRNQVRSTPPRASGSGYRHSRRNDASQEHDLTAEEKAAKLIMEAEAAKAKLFAPQGKHGQSSNINKDQCNYRFTAEIDEDYLVIRSHVDAAMGGSNAG